MLTIAVGIALVIGAGFATAFVVDPTLEQAVIAALLDVLARHHIEPKVAARLFGYSEAQWSRICAGTLHLPSLTRFFNLPWPVVQDFIPEYCRLMAKHKLLGITEQSTRRV